MMLPVRTALRRGGTGRAMSSVFRLDEASGHWIVYAGNRKNRPHQTSQAKLTVKMADIDSNVKDCPFCFGNEHMTPETLLTIGDAENITRVVPNKFPAVSGHDINHCESLAVFRDNTLLNNQIKATGHHEVVIESPLHNAQIGSTPGMAERLLLAWRDRGQALEADQGLEHIMYFKNHGATAGASLVHPHSQIVATPIVPIQCQTLMSRALEYWEKSGQNLYERIIVEEMAAGVRIIEESEDFVALVPYAAPSPFTIQILPKFPESSNFTCTTSSQLLDCAQLLRRCIIRLNNLLDEPCFNLVLQSSPLPGRGKAKAYCHDEFFRWHLRIMPRLGAGAMAGFELGSGIFSNSSLPEVNAEQLRGVII